MGRVRVVQCGMGPIGQRVTSEVGSRGNVEIVGAVDVSADLVGRDVGELAGGAPLGVAVTDDVEGLLRSIEADVAIVTTSSSLEACAEHARPFIAAGLHVVSSCEELAFPWLTAPDVAARLDEAAKTNGVAVLGTGINPGFLMDLLPLAVTGLASRVDHLTVERVQDASRRRLPFQKKVGAGLDLDEFARRVEAKTLRHVGLTESLHMIATRLGWQLTKTQDVVEPVVAEEPWRSGDLEVAAGQALGVEQVGRGWVGDEEVLHLRFRAAVGQADAVDRVVLRGEPSYTVEIPGGMNGDAGTCAILVNAARAVMDAPAGLRTMADIPPVTPRVD